MRISPRLFALAILPTLALPLATSEANAKGCIKGAIVGGIAGHVVHHGVIGAIGGCIVGRHNAKEKERAERLQRERMARPGDRDL